MQTTNHRVLASLPTRRASSSQPRVLNAVAVLVILIAAVLGVAAAAVVAHDVAGRDAGTALASSTQAAQLDAQAVCDSDASCAAYDAAHHVFYAPDYDAAGEPTCPLGQHLFDTENPDEGDSGIVCVVATKAV